MAINYTYDDFNKYVGESGLKNQFSNEDYALASSNPNAGMSILNAKKDWNSATTAEGKAQANQRAENIRSQYSGYTSGTGGNRYNATQPSPGDFKYDKFDYLPDADPVYKSYLKSYTRDGRRAAADTMGTVSAATGGIPSSYAASAASQANNNYMAALNDKIPELFQNARNNYNTDRSFAYGNFIDEYNSQNAERQEGWQNAMTAAEYGDYSGLNNLGVNTTNNSADRQYQYNLAILAAQNGDYSGLQRLGITPDQYIANPLIQSIIQTAANNGNYEPYNEMVKKYGLGNAAISIPDYSAAVGGYSGGSGGSGYSSGSGSSGYSSGYSPTPIPNENLAPYNKTKKDVQTDIYNKWKLPAWQR